MVWCRPRPRAVGFTAWAVSLETGSRPVRACRCGGGVAQTVSHSAAALPGGRRRNRPAQGGARTRTRAPPGLELPTRAAKGVWGQIRFELQRARSSLRGLGVEAVRGRCGRASGLPLLALQLFQMLPMNGGWARSHPRANARDVVRNFGNVQQSNSWSYSSAASSSGSIHCSVSGSYHQPELGS